MGLGHVQGSSINHALSERAFLGENICTRCGITSHDVRTLTRTTVERPMCDFCWRVLSAELDAIERVG
jgi:hypothetical protein